MYSGLATSGTIDGVMFGQAANATSLDSGPLVTTHAHDMLIAAESSFKPATGPSATFTTRTSGPFGDIVEDREVQTADSYDAQLAIVTQSGGLVELVALRGL